MAGRRHGTPASRKGELSLVAINSINMWHEHLEMTNYAHLGEIHFLTFSNSLPIDYYNVPANFKLILHFCFATALTHNKTHYAVYK